MMRHLAKLFVIHFCLLGVTPTLYSASFEEEAEFQMVDVYLNGWLLQLAVTAYTKNQELYLPLKELGDYLGLPHELDLASAYYQADPLTDQPGFSLKAQDDQQLLYRASGVTEVWPEESWLPEALEFDLDLFVQGSYLEQLWPLKVQYDPRRLRVNITSEASFPELDARLRALDREAQLKRLEHRKESRQAAPGLPYSAASPPIIEWRYFNDLKAERQLASLNLRHDLAGLGHEWQLQAGYNPDAAASQPEIQRFRWKASYTAAEKDSPKPLFLPRLDFNSQYIEGTQHFEVGDRRQRGHPGIGSSFEGRGIKLSGFPQSSHSLFDEHQVRGQAPPGWEADLYLNNQLIDHQIVDETGEYRFDVLLEQGNNQVNVHLYGPFGEMRIDRSRFQLGDEFLPKGRWATSYEIIEPGVRFFDVEEASSRAQDPTYQQAFNLGYGFQTGLGFIGHLFHEHYEDEEVLIGGWTLAGSNLGWQWRWQQLFEDEQHFSRLQMHYALNGWQFQLSAADHPDWPSFQRQGQLLKRRYSLGSDYHLRASTLPLRLGLTFSQEDYSTHQVYELDASQQFRFGLWRFNFNQEHTQNTQRNYGLSNFNNRAVYRRGALQSSLFIDAQHAQEWQRVRFGGQVRYRLNRLFRNSQLGDYTRNMTWRGHYRANHNLQTDVTDATYSTDLAWQHTFKHLAVGASLGWHDEEGYQASFQLSGTLLPGRDGYQARGESFERPVQITAFHDQNYSGQLDDANPRLSDISFIQGNRRSSLTDEDGEVWVDLSPNLPLTLDLRSVEDPYQISGRSPLLLNSRPERAVHISWPLMDTGSVEGTLTDPEGQALANQKLTLVPAEESEPFATMYTAFDGFWVFEFVPPGHYQIHLHEGESSKQLAEVTVTPENLWVTVDLDLDDSGMQLADRAQEVREEQLGEEQEKRISRHQAFLQDFIEENYQLLAIKEGAAVLLEKPTGQVAQVNLGEQFSHFAGVLVILDDRFAEFHFGKTPYPVRLDLDTEDILSQPGDYYTLQLVSSSNEARVQAFAARYSQQQPVFYYQREHPDLPWVAISGSFPSVRAANKTLKQLPEELKPSKPWVRPLSSVHQEMLPIQFSQLQPEAPSQDLAESTIRLLAQPGKRFTLQLGASSSKAGVQRILNRYGQQLELDYYQRDHASLPWVVVMGSYSSVREASAARDQLPTELQRYQPWVRPFTAIHEELFSQEDF